MTTNPKLDRNAVLAARQSLQPVREGGRLGGFGNLFSKEMGEWFATRRWIVHLVIWVAIINGFIAFVLAVSTRADVAASQSAGQTPPADIMVLQLFFSFGAIFGGVGMIILGQDEIIREKQTGTAAWILSKPVARPSFILTKLLSNVIGGLIFIILIPALVAYVELYLAAQKTLPISSYLLGLGVLLLNLLFYLTLVLMLGVLFEQRGPVLGISLGLLFGGSIASSLLPQVGYILPVSMQNIAQGLAAGQPLPPIAIAELVATALWCILFIIVALWRFNRLEF
jgi:ABC-2 type transport system permease protein